jgi:signal transduction histidine kinase
LYILKEAVMKLGGIVEAESMLDGGTTFTIYLPNPEVAEVH